MNYKGTEETIRLTLQTLAREAAAAAEPGGIVPTERIVALAMDVARLVERRKTQMEAVREMALRDGVEDGNGNRIRFERYIGPRERRTAEVYPYLRNDGATFGLVVDATCGDSSSTTDRFCGGGWTRETAIEAARRWVNDGVMPPRVNG
jgi:hypothetical protein